jgi:hypothetical protein
VPLNEICLLQNVTTGLPQGSGVSFSSIVVGSPCRGGGGMHGIDDIARGVFKSRKTGIGDVSALNPFTFTIASARKTWGLVV